MVVAMATMSAESVVKHNSERLRAFTLDCVLVALRGRPAEVLSRADAHLLPSTCDAVRRMWCRFLGQPRGQPSVQASPWRLTLIAVMDVVFGAG